jgi:hypothetical protein
MRRGLPLVVALIAAVAGPARAAVPANDDFAAAAAIASLPSSQNGSTIDATSERGEPLPCAHIDNTVWYSFTATESLPLVAYTSYSYAGGVFSYFDNVLAVYRGTDLRHLEQIACEDDTLGYATYFAQVRFDAEAGTTYYFQIGGFQGKTGNYSFVLYTPPANDAFASAVPVASPLPQELTQSTFGATRETDEPRPCASIGATVWYRLVLPESSGVVVDTEGSSFDSAVAVYSGESLSGLTLIGCNEDYFVGGSYRPQARLQFPGARERTYYVQIGGDYGTSGDLHLTVTRYPIPANDMLVDAIPASDGFSDTRDNATASQEPGESPSSCGPVAKTLWYRYTPAANASVLLAALGGQSNLNTVVAVYTGGSVEGLTEVAGGCADEPVLDAVGTNVGLPAVLRFPAIAGQTYSIQVGNFRSGGSTPAGGSITFTLRESAA